MNVFLIPRLSKNVKKKKKQKKKKKKKETTKGKTYAWLNMEEAEKQRSIGAEIIDKNEKCINVWLAIVE
jgi:hypothetical protein